MGAEKVYESPTATVWYGDSREVLASLATESVDLIVTDPPYGQAWRSNQRTERFDVLHNDGAGDRGIVHNILRECVRLVGQNRHLYVFGPTDVLDGLKVAEPVELVWDKTMMSGGDVSSVWGPAHESISFTLSKHRHAGQTGATSIPARIRKGSVLRFGRPTGRKVRHPSEKPVPLLRELVESSSRQGELVLDPFAGVGSTGVAAILAGRRVMLADSHRPWVDIMVARVRAAEAHAALAVGL